MKRLLILATTSICMTAQHSNACEVLSMHVKEMSSQQITKFLPISDINTAINKTKSELHKQETLLVRKSTYLNEIKKNIGKKLRHATESSVNSMASNGYNNTKATVKPLTNAIIESQTGAGIIQFSVKRVIQAYKRYINGLTHRDFNTVETFIKESYVNKNPIPEDDKIIYTFQHLWQEELDTRANEIIIQDSLDKKNQMAEELNEWINYRVAEIKNWLNVLTISCSNIYDMQEELEHFQKERDATYTHINQLKIDVNKLTSRNQALHQYLRKR